MTTSVTLPSSGSRIHSTSTSSSSTPPISQSGTASSPSDQAIVRKKRTFDIAFLTGQSEKESSSNISSRGDSVSSLPLQSSHRRNSPPISSSKSLISSAASANNNNVIERKYAVFHPYSGIGEDVQEQDGTNSDSSSIDVMTNGSLSESESQSHSPLSSISEQPSPPLHPVVLIHHQQQHQLSRSNGSGSNEVRGISQNRVNGNNSGHLHHHQQQQHHHNIKSNGGGSGSNKIRNNRSPVKDEIRFESRRTIDINHTVDSLKIKENLHFSTLLPSSSIGLNLSSSNNGGGDPIPASSSSAKVISTADLTLPHLASTIALLPHVARFPLGLSPSGMFPGGHPPPPHLMAAAAAAASGNLPFHAKMEKSESINISYPKIRSGGNVTGGAAPFPDPYAAAALAAAGGYPYPNLLAGLTHHHHHHPSASFPNPLGSPPRPGGSGGTGSISTSSIQQVSPQPATHHQQTSQHSPPQVSPCGLSPSATLLPPSLTSLTLPAQNVCAKCNIGFRMTSDLVYHMRSHHKRDADPVKRQREEKLKCPVCHETFRERHHLTRHMTAHQDRAEEQS